MNGEKWFSIRENGLTNYILFTGLLKTGVLGGLFIITIHYLNKLDFIFEKFDFQEYVFEYLMWWPVLGFVGVINALVAWYYFEEKFNSDEKE